MKGHETKLQMPLSDWERLNTSLQGLKIVDVTGIVQGLRMVKSEAEIMTNIYVLLAQRLLKLFRVALGMPEEVFREFRLSAIRHGADDTIFSGRSRSRGLLKCNLTSNTTSPSAWRHNDA